MQTSSKWQRHVKIHFQQHSFCVNGQEKIFSDFHIYSNEKESHLGHCLKCTLFRHDDNNKTSWYIKNLFNHISIMLNSFKEVFNPRRLDTGKMIDEVKKTKVQPRPTIQGRFQGARVWHFSNDCCLFHLCNSHSKCHIPKESNNGPLCLLTSPSYVFIWTFQTSWAWVRSWWWSGSGLLSSTVRARVIQRLEKMSSQQGWSSEETSKAEMNWDDNSLALC